MEKNWTNWIWGKKTKKIKNKLRKNWKQTEKTSLLEGIRRTEQQFHSCPTTRFLERLRTWKTPTAKIEKLSSYNKTWHFETCAVHKTCPFVWIEHFGRFLPRLHWGISCGHFLHFNLTSKSVNHRLYGYIMIHILYNCYIIIVNNLVNRTPGFLSEQFWKQTLQARALGVLEEFCMRSCTAGAGVENVCPGAAARSKSCWTHQWLYHLVI